MPDPRDLEPSSKQLRAEIDAAAQRVVEHLASLPDQPAMDLDGAETAAEAFVEDPPEQGRDLEAILDRVLEEAVPKSLNAAHPGYLAYIPGGGLTDALLADMVADATNRYTGVRAAAPALVQIEATAIDWLCDVVGYGEGSGGIFTSGGSIANQTAVTTARFAKLDGAIRDGAIYASDQTHHSVAKAARLAGFTVDQVREVPTDDRYRLDVDALIDRVAEDRGAGRRPLMVVANAGTTNTGAVDPLDAVADVCADADLWLHVDGAYGGLFRLTDRGADRLEGIARADSVTVDPHKTLFLPYGVGSLLVRDVDALERAHSLPADYLPKEGETEGVDFSHLSPELSKPFRGLRVWLAVKRHGLATFRAALDEKLDLADLAAEKLAAIDDIELVDDPQLSVVAFRYEPDGADPEQLDELNRELLARVNERANVHISGTTLDGVFTPRLAIVSFRTHRDHVEQAIDDVRDVTGELGGSL